MTTIIGLLGPAGSGKSSVAEHLVAKYGARRYSLATLLKEIARRTLSFADEQVYGTQAQKEAVDARYGFSARWFLQRLGTEGVRAVLGEDFWTLTLLKKIRDDKAPYAVVDDLRFCNESEIIGSSPTGHVWRLHPPEDAAANEREAAAGAHASEREWRYAKADCEIKPACRGLPELFEIVDYQCRSFGLRRLPEPEFAVDLVVTP